MTHDAERDQRVGLMFLNALDAIPADDFSPHTFTMQAQRIPDDPGNFELRGVTVVKT